VKVSLSSFLCFIFVGIVVCLNPITIIAAGPKGTIYTFTVPKHGGMVADPTYYCWIPDTVKVLRCVIVHQHGCGREGDGPQMVNDVQWTTLAKKWHAAFIAPSLVTGSNCGNWNNIDGGSGDAFLAALDTLAKRSTHPEIKTVPWALWGHSGGAMWITSMVGKYPDRIAVGVAQSCGKDVSNVPAALKVPVLHHNGTGDLCYNGTLFESGRTKGALWVLAVNAGSAGHGTANMRTLSIPWIDFALAARLPDSAGAPASNMKPMDTANAYLGDTATHVIAPAASFTGNKQLAAWFPNRTMAIFWRDYCTTPKSAQGIIKDSTPSPAPYNLTGAYANRSVALKWDADADLETGIKTFIVYRDGTLLKTLTYTTRHPWINATGYQGWDYGDNPVPTPAPAMTYTDASLSDTATYTYQVATVNWEDGAGTKSNSLVIKKGLVVATASVQNTGIVHRSTSTRLKISNGFVDARTGIVNIFDIRGCLLKTVAVKKDGQVDIRALLGANAEKAVIINNIAE
jgi:pimeloyl-ACP methyl ester carboxylesterase